MIKPGRKLVKVIIHRRSNIESERLWSHPLKSFSLRAAAAKAREFRSSSSSGGGGGSSSTRSSGVAAAAAAEDEPCARGFTVHVNYNTDILIFVNIVNLCHFNSTLAFKSDLKRIFSRPSALLFLTL